MQGGKYLPTRYIQNLCEFADFAFAPAFLKFMWTGIRFLFCEMFSRDSVLTFKVVARKFIL